MQWTNAYDLAQIGRHIRMLRKEQGYTQADFSEVVGVSHATLSALENGKSVSSKALMRALAFLGQKLVIAPRGASVIVSSEGEGKGGADGRAS